MTTETNAAPERREWYETDDQLLKWLYDESHKRITKMLNGMFRTFGRMDRQELGAMLDGARDAVMNWTVPK